jgi:hypothetical protein
MAIAPTLVLHVEGGVIQEIAADTAVEVIVLDYDTDGVDDASITRDGCLPAVVSRWQVIAHPTQIAQVLQQYHQALTQAVVGVDPYA